MLFSYPAVLGALIETVLLSTHNQGSNLALANLLNASVFFKKASWNYHHLLFLASKYKSFSHQPISKLCINCLINSVDPDQPVLLKQCRSWSDSFWTASFSRSWLIWIYTVCKVTQMWFQKGDILNDFLHDFLPHILSNTYAIIEFVQVNKQVEH